MVSESYDPSRILVENLVLIGGGLFSGYTLIFVIITGKSDEALPNLVRLYRNSLSHVSFLVVSNILLTTIFALLIYQLTFFRQVEFLSPTDVEIYLGDELGKPERLAFLRAKDPTYLRLSIGEHKIVVKDVVTQEMVQSKFLEVPCIFSEWKMISTWIDPKRKPYEPVN